MGERRLAVIMIYARKGEVQEVRGIVGRAIRSSLGVRRWLEDDHWVAYHRREGDQSPRYTLYVTDAEMDRLVGEIEDLEVGLGWRLPIEIFHD